MFSPKDKETRKARGFTFCQYHRKEDAAEAVKGMDKRVWVFRLNCGDSVVMQTQCRAVSCFVLCHLHVCLLSGQKNEIWVADLFLLSPTEIDIGML